MPVIIVRRPIAIERRGNRGRHFDRAVEALAAEINALRARGVQSLRALADALNAAGKRTPSGEFFSHTTVRRFLKRMARLQLGAGSRSPRVAANDRRPRTKAVFNVNTSDRVLSLNG
jgi:hypothetical protein